MSNEDLSDEVGEIVEAENEEMKTEVEAFDEEEKLIEEKLNEEKITEEKLIEEKLIEEKLIEEKLIEEKLIEEKLIEEQLIEEQAIVIRDDDIIPLNVGGQQFSTKRSTLCQVEGSLFATIFSGDCEDSLERDEDGAVCFDFNPQHFGLILDYLESREISIRENPATVFKFPDDQVKDFNVLVESLGLIDEIVANQIVPGEKFNLHSAGISLEEDGKVAAHDGTRGHKYVLGKNIYQEGIVHLKLKFESFEDNHWMFIGILEGDVVRRDDDHSYEWSGSYGWSLGSSGYEGIWREGLGIGDNTLVNLTKQVDEVTLVINCYSAKLSLHSTTGHQFHIDIPENKIWRLNINMFLKSDKIRLL